MKKTVRFLLILLRQHLNFTIGTSSKWLFLRANMKCTMETVQLQRA
jgi:hypothetical protein